MSFNKNFLRADRIRKPDGREATILEHDSLRVMIDDFGGMTPELSAVLGKKRINAHWTPWFRDNSGKPFGAFEKSFWKAELLYHIAGNFLCAPNFGGDSDLDGMELPPHGWAANSPWSFRGKNIDNEAAWAVSTLECPEPKLPLSFRKIDAVLRGHAVHYTSLEITNNGKTDTEICVAWHNTAGSPLLESGCVISGAANRWAVTPAGGEFDNTTRLRLGAEFDSLKHVPLASGGTADISVVPGPIGYTDMVCGAIPASAPLGWSALVNPRLKMAYVCLFKGPAAAEGDEIILRFNALWMQYGGRSYTPWACEEGGTDLCFCLGTENSAAGFAYGLKYAREKKELLGAPTTVRIPAGKTRTLRYGTFFAPYEGNYLDSGVSSAEAGEDQLILNGKTGGRFAADTAFKLLKRLETEKI